MKLSGIRVCIWDFDGTLYKQQPALLDEIRESEYRVLMDHMGWNHTHAVEAFHNVYLKKTPSGTQTVSLVAGISMKAAAVETTKYVDYRKYLSPDSKLAEMFVRLAGYKHMMLVNGTQQSVTHGLSLMEINRALFDEIVTSEIVGETKPSTKGFKYILKKTGLPPAAHLMIGDREQVDLVPAKSLGMKTCLVWSDTQSTIADVTLPTVYALTDVLG